MILVKNTLHKCVFETIIKACSINSRKGSIVVPCIALHCLFAFIWHLSLTLSESIVPYAPSRNKQHLLS